MQLKTKLILLGMCLGGLVKADTIVLETSRAALGANDSVLWNQLGSDGSTINSSFSATSTGSVSVGGSFTAGTGELVMAGGPNWSPVTGAFNNNDFLVWAFTGNNGAGPLTLTFPSNFGAGMAIEDDCCGQFTAKVELFHGTTSLGFVTETSNSNGDAIYIGALDTTGPNVTKAVVSLTSVAVNGNNYSNNTGDFAIDKLDLVNVVQTGTPEPGTFGLLGSALIGFWALSRKAMRG